MSNHKAAMLLAPAKPKVQSFHVLGLHYHFNAATFPLAVVLIGAVGMVTFLVIRGLRARRTVSQGDAPVAQRSTTATYSALGGFGALTVPLALAHHVKKFHIGSLKLAHMTGQEGAYLLFGLIILFVALLFWHFVLKPSR